MTEFEASYKRAMNSFGIVHGTSFSGSYVQSVDDAIMKAFESLQREATRTQNVGAAYAKGNLAEVWHEGTFNASAAARGKPEVYAEALSNT